MHQQRSDDEPKPLAVPYPLVVQAEAFQYSSKHYLAFTALFSKHLNIGKTPPNIFANQALIRTGFSTESLKFFVKCTVSCSSYTGPHHTS